MIGFRRTPRALGRRGEALAARALRREGYAILDRNVQLGRYEVDIIAQEGDTIAFVEVKTRRSDSVAFPEDNVGQKKQHHLRQAANTYMAQRDDPDMYYRFDVVSVLLPGWFKASITIHRNAF